MDGLSDQIQSNLTHSPLTCWKFAAQQRKGANLRDDIARRYDRSDSSLPVMPALIDFRRRTYSHHSFLLIYMSPLRVQGRDIMVAGNSGRSQVVDAPEVLNLN